MPPSHLQANVTKIPNARSSLTTPDDLTQPDQVLTVVNRVRSDRRQINRAQLSHRPSGLNQEKCSYYHTWIKNQNKASVSTETFGEEISYKV